MVQTVHKGEYTKGITEENGKLIVKAGDNIRVDEQGVHAVIPEIPEGLADVTLSGSTLTFTKTKGSAASSVVLPSAPEAPVALNNASIDGRTLTFAKTDSSTAVEVTLPNGYKTASISGNTITITKLDDTTDVLQLPATPVDVKLQSLTFTDTGKLKATLSDGTTTEVDFSAESVLKALESMGQPQKARFKAVVLDLIKGEELQNLAGETKGYLLPVA